MWHVKLHWIIKESYNQTQKNRNENLLTCAKFDRVHKLELVINYINFRAFIIF